MNLKKNKFLVTLLSFISFQVQAINVELDNIYYELWANEALSGYYARVIKNPNKYVGDIVIPASLSYDDKTYNVIEIGDDAFSDCIDLISVELPEGLTHIESGAFSGCTGLTSIVLPNSLVFMGNYVFSYCTNLKKVSFPINKDFSFIGHEFDFCSGLTSIEIPSSVTSIDGFVGCSGLTSLVIPKTTIEISDYSFTSCENISSIKVEKENPVYDSRDNCNAIIETSSNVLIKGCKETKIPSGVSKIGKAAFYGCRYLESVDLSTIKHIDKEAFSKCVGIRSLNLPENINIIESQAFNECTALTSVIIPKGLKEIPSVFTNCTSLTSVTISEGVINISDAFSGCSSLTDVIIPNTVTEFYMAFFACTSLSSVKIPEGIVTISGEAFEYSGVMSVYIPSSAHTVNYCAFGNCDNLKDVYCYAENPPVPHKFSFQNTEISRATLHVPAKSLDLYKSAEIWKEFGNIVALTKIDGSTRINSLEADSDNHPRDYYSINGTRLSHPQQGINILHLKDGSTKKIIVK